MTAGACTNLLSCPFILVLLLLQAWQATARCGQAVLTRESRRPGGMSMVSTDMKPVMRYSASHPGGQCWQLQSVHNHGKAACAAYCCRVQRADARQ